MVIQILCINIRLQMIGCDAKPQISVIISSQLVKVKAEMSTEQGLKSVIKLIRPTFVTVRSNSGSVKAGFVCVTGKLKYLVAGAYKNHFTSTSALITLFLSSDVLTQSPCTHVRLRISISQCSFARVSFPERRSQLLFTRFFLLLLLCK